MTLKYLTLLKNSILILLKLNFIIIIILLLLDKSSTAYSLFKQNQTFWLLTKNFSHVLLLLFWVFVYVYIYDSVILK